MKSMLSEVLREKVSREENYKEGKGDINNGDKRGAQRLSTHRNSSGATDQLYPTIEMSHRIGSTPDFQPDMFKINYSTIFRG